MDVFKSQRQTKGLAGRRDSAPRLTLVRLLACLALAITALANAAEENPNGDRFWAYQLPRKSIPPSVTNIAWPYNDVDRFLLAKLESKGLRPVTDADRTTLLRRVYYDLVGLPPTPDEVDDFVQDQSPNAFARLVERLLASPQFGERWARHWLDVARFGESVTLRGFVFKEAWRYRDYVIDAFNRDLPYDRFVQEQLAGDLMPASSLQERRRQLTATTFLTLGNTVLEEQDKAQLRMDVVDEQLDTIGKAFLAQTIGCARCHDHKFDPIPTRDYYAMAGILRSTKTLIHANVSNWIEAPLPEEAGQEQVLKQHEAAVTALQSRVKLAKETLAKLAATSEGGSNRAAVAIAAKDLPGIVVDDAEAKRVGEWKHSQYSARYIGAGYLHDLDTGKGEKTLTFQPELPKAGKYEIRLAYIPSSNRSTEVPVTVFSADGEAVIRVNQKITPPIDGRFVSLGQHRFEQNGQGFVLVSNQGTAGHVIADAVQFIPVDELETPIAPIQEKSSSPARSAKGEQGTDAKKMTDDIKRLESELKRLVESGPKRSMVMSVQEEEQIGDAAIHIRGSVHNLAAKVPRGFLRVATYGAAPAMPTSESGRREFGQWLATPLNPLTSRVMVNRVWHWLFGAGLVRTTDNFGATGELPSHPELLDYLAVRFMEEGWSMKWLIRELTLSHAYQLASTEVAPNQVVENLGRVFTDAATADPENRLLWRMNRRRLEAECIRDTILSVSGQLKLNSTGPTITPGTAADYGYKDTETRRSIYVPVLRNALPELFEAFDFADPSVVAGVRNVSTVAPQALFLMNHPFVVEQARHAAERSLTAPFASERERIKKAFQLVLSRPPTEGELVVALKYLAGAPDEKGQAQSVEHWTELFQTLFASVDFRYLH